MQGFTLLEVLVSITIIGILTAAILTAYPRNRQSQSLALTEQRLATLIRQAQEKALNEERAEDCLALVTQPRVCSDIGVAVREKTLTLYADINQNISFDDGSDFVLATQNLPGAVVGADMDLVFRGVPPSIRLFADDENNEIRSDASPASVEFSTADLSMTINVFRYGFVVRQ